MATKKKPKDTTDYVLLDRAELKKTRPREIEPEKLTLIKNPDHFLYDPRVHFKPKEHTVLGIMEFGIDNRVGVAVLPAPTGDEDKCILAVYDGRQSVINCLEANRRLAEENKGPERVMLRIRKGDTPEFKLQLKRLGVITNEHRTADDPVTKGEKAQDLLDGGVPIEQVCLDFGGVHEQSINNWTSLLELASQVKEMVRDGRLPMTKALRLLKLSKADQVKEAKRIIEKRPRKPSTGKTKHAGVDKRKLKNLHRLGGHQKTKNKTVQLIFDWLVGEVDDKAVESLIDFSVLEKKKAPSKKAPAKKKAASKKKPAAKKKAASKKKATSKRHPSWDKHAAKKKAASKKATAKK